jgi:ribosome-associated protein
MSSTESPSAPGPLDSSTPESSVDTSDLTATAIAPRRRSEILSSSEQVRVALHAALDRKAEEAKVMYLAKISDFTDHFLICTGNNERQVQAISDAIVEELGKRGVDPLHIEGKLNARWILLDFGGDFVAHVFLAEARRFYNLERLWSDAPDVTGLFEARPAP